MTTLATGENDQYTRNLVSRWADQEGKDPSPKPNLFIKFAQICQKLKFGTRPTQECRLRQLSASRLLPHQFCIEAHLHFRSKQETLDSQWHKQAGNARNRAVVNVNSFLFSCTPVLVCQTTRPRQESTRFHHANLAEADLARVT